MRRWTAAALALLAGCSHPRSAPGVHAGSGTEMVRCAKAQLADMGYGVGPGDAANDQVRGEKWLPPESGYEGSLAVITAWVRYGREGQPSLKVRAQRFGQTATSRPPRRGPGTTGPQPFPLPGGTGETYGTEGGRRLPLGRVANEAGRVETTCR
jgi:hypothetical protein